VARVPVGNVYYYFKTKEELAEAVMERRLEEFRTARAEWDRLSSPNERLLAFVGSATRTGSNLRAEDVQLAACAPSCTRRACSREEIRALFTEPIGWLEKQFGPPAAIRTHVNLQCISSLLSGDGCRGHGANDPEVVVMEVRRLKNWINTL